MEVVEKFTKILMREGFSFKEAKLEARRILDNASVVCKTIHSPFLRDNPITKYLLKKGSDL